MTIGRHREERRIIIDARCARRPSQALGPWTMQMDADQLFLNVIFMLRFHAVSQCYLNKRLAFKRGYVLFNVFMEVRLDLTLTFFSSPARVINRFVSSPLLICGGCEELWVFWYPLAL